MVSLRCDGAFPRFRPIRTGPAQFGAGPFLGMSTHTYPHETRFIEIIDTTLREQGVSRSELARRLGLSQGQVSTSLNKPGPRGMAQSTFDRYMAALGVEYRVEVEVK